MIIINTTSTFLIIRIDIIAIGIAHVWNAFEKYKILFVSLCVHRYLKYLLLVYSQNKSAPNLKFPKPT